MGGTERQGLPQEEGVIFGYDNDGEVTILQASREKILKKLLDPTFRSKSYPKHFMLTHPYIISGEELLEHLTSKFAFSTRVRQEWTPKEITFHRHKASWINSRIILLLSLWIEYRFPDMDDGPFRSKVLSFCNKALHRITDTTLLADLRALVRKLIHPVHDPFKSFVTDMETPTISDKDEKYRWKLSYLPLHETAFLLIKYQWCCFKRIRPCELLFANWEKKPHLSPNLLACASFHNKISMFCQATVLAEKESKKRGEILCQFIKFARILVEQQNYDMAFAMAYGLTMKPIERLIDDWAYVSKKEEAQLESVKALLSFERNYHKYRTLLKQIKAPAIPLFSVHQKEVFSTDDVQDTYIKDPKTGEKKINFGKLSLIAESIREFLRFQKDGYFFPPAEVPEVAIGLVARMPIEEYKNHFFDLSYAIMEPDYLKAK